MKYNEINYGTETTTAYKDEKYVIYKSTMAKSHVYDVHMPDDIGEKVEEFFPLVQFFKKGCKKADLVRIHLTSTGGQVIIGHLICNAIKECPAYTHVIVDSGAYSCGALIALCGDKLTLAHTAILMFHNVSYVADGSLDLMGSQYKHLLHSSKIADKYYCSPFLTDKELKTILDDKEIYIYGSDKDLKDRIARHYKT